MFDTILFLQSPRRFKVERAQHSTQRLAALGQIRPKCSYLATRWPTLTRTWLNSTSTWSSGQISRLFAKFAESGRARRPQRPRNQARRLRCHGKVDNTAAETATAPQPGPQSPLPVTPFTVHSLPSSGSPVCDAPRLLPSRPRWGAHACGGSLRPGFGRGVAQQTKRHVVLPHRPCSLEIPHIVIPALRAPFR